jgi:anti-sigma factor ChrR (cupin superfamily)
MPERIVDISSIQLDRFDVQVTDTDQSSGIWLRRIDFGPCELVLVRYEAGANVPSHSHSSNTWTVVLQGKLQGPEGYLLPGMIVECIGEYGPRTVEEEVYLLVMQLPGTTYLPSERT